MTWAHVLLSVCVPLLIVLVGWALLCLWRMQEFEHDARAEFDDEGESRL